MEAETPSGKETIEGIEIDYDNLDVAAIMAQVKRVAAQTPAEPAEPPREQATAASPEPSAPAPLSAPPAAPGLKAVLKSKLLRAMRPFYPVIRFLGLPLHEDIKAAVVQIDQTNRRLDEISERRERRLDELQERIDQRFNDFSAEFDRFRDRLDLRLTDLDRSMEYIKLLHTLDHNLVVEITKLRIEFEGLKSKARILEKDLDAQSQREKVLEKRLLS
ncbi:MAG: hypothetical protein ACYDH3_05065 [Candidatus Aminicenantales bacterium]